MLRERSLRELEAETTAKRMGWLEGRADFLRSASITPRLLFETLFFEYMGLTRADLPVVSESGEQITWLSRNPCPTLEACTRAGLDTRTVCKGAYERPTQAFLSWFDPRFRFIRDYGEIRPWSNHCREQISIALYSERVRREANGAQLRHEPSLEERGHELALRCLRQPDDRQGDGEQDVQRWE